MPFVPAMKKRILLSLIFCISVLFIFSSKPEENTAYKQLYFKNLASFSQRLQAISYTASSSNISGKEKKQKIETEILEARKAMKKMDFWMRYLEPLAYKKINSPLPVEWETEVFEKYEAPYKREGAGLTLASLYVNEEATIDPQKLQALIQPAIAACNVYRADTITKSLNDYHQFFLCNRLYLLNLAAIYTTGFECPNAEEIIPELQFMLAAVGEIYEAYNQSVPATPLPENYLRLYRQTIAFAGQQPSDFALFDHFVFLRDYVNPLFLLNQKLINQYHVVSHSNMDYALNKKEVSIFSKSLYNGQNRKGIFLRVDDTAVLAEVKALGKLLFFDPILSGNNMRSCASCHKPENCFTDTALTTAFNFNHKDFLPRNTPTLLNAKYNHLLMADGKHFTLQHQAEDVVMNDIEMSGGGNETTLLKKILSCKTYRNGFKNLLKYTPTEKEINFNHISSALTFYYTSFSKYDAPFDHAMNESTLLEAAAKAGFNLFMSKAQCATCHFAPQFNGVKPPYIGSEFEVIGVPADNAYTKLSEDKGRYIINPAMETMNAFRTGTVRNAARTAPYMHNGVFKTMNQVIDFYDAGGGIGHGLLVENQTLSADSLHLSSLEKQQLIAFINSLTEEVNFETPPASLPVSKIKNLNARKVGGEY